MAYACPVCEGPQVDAEHLANHLAFTAIAGDAEHEAWLDATVEEWGQLGQAELGTIVVEHAEETDFPVDLDEEVGASRLDSRDEGPHQHDHPGTPHGSGHSHDAGSAGDSLADSRVDTLDEDAQDVLADARELTRQMRSNAEPDDEDAGEGAASDSETQ